MPPDGQSEADQLAEIEADLAALTTHIDTWIQDRFLSSESADALNVSDVAGLVAWLQQWHTHFDSYAGTATPAVAARLAQIRTEIDNSIATFTQMAATLPQDQEG